MEHKLKIEYKDIDTLIPYVNNTRTHSKEQIEQVKTIYDIELINYYGLKKYMGFEKEN